jgi:FkbM family methyltransferase
MSILDGIAWYYDLCGVRGIGAAASFQLFDWPRELTVTARGTSHPVHLRMGTSDFCAYKDVLVCREKEYDPRMADFSPSVIVDAGAHIGMASISFACSYPQARIIAVEPEPSNFAALLRNIAPYQNIVPVNAAIWKDDGEVCLGPCEVHPKGAFQIVERGQVLVRAMTMRTLMREMGIQVIDFLKVDIEGAEKETFEACDWIESVRTIAIELHDRVKPGCRAALQMAATDFRFEDRGEVTFCFSQRPPSADRAHATKRMESALRPSLVRSRPC